MNTNNNIIAKLGENGTEISKFSNLPSFFARILL